MMFRTYEDVAQEFRRRFRHDPDPKAWELAVAWQWIDEVIEYADEADWVFDRIREMESGPRSQQPRAAASESKKELPADWRALALVRIRAIDAARDPLVKAFREECLRGRLVKPSRIRQWLEKHEEEQGETARYVKRWERADGTRIGSLNLRPYGPDTRWKFGGSASSVDLQYPGGAVNVSPDSNLGRLKFLASALVHRYLWSEEEAVAFILSGTVPSAFLGCVTIRDQSRSPRVTIEVDPRVRESDVLRLYKWARDPEAAKARLLSEVHAELAVFAAERNDGREWSRVLEEWNETHPQDLYAEPRNFTRDCRRAYERITGESLGWLRQRGAAGRRRRRSRDD